MEDLSIYSEQLNKAIKSSQCFPFDLNCDALASQWYEAKKYFIKAFGGKPIVRFKEKIKIELSQQEQEERFQTFLSTLNNEINISDEFLDYLTMNKKGFFINRTIEDYRPYNIHSGSKLSRTFKYFLPDEEITRWSQDLASRYMQENKIEGYLYLSVHPLDYLTMSETNEGWHSCHSLDGSYRGGNLNYMVDNTTIVAYLADEENKKLRALEGSGLTWNSKKWRVLIHYNKENEAIYLNKQYPYSCNTLAEKVVEGVENYCCFKYHAPALPIGIREFKGSDGEDVFSTSQIFFGKRVFDSEDIIDRSEYLGYSDLHTGSNYLLTAALPLAERNDFWYNSYNSLMEEYRDTKKLCGIKIGKFAICPCCGKHLIISDGSSLLCDNCRLQYNVIEDFFETCYDCGRRVYSNEKHVDKYGHVRCKRCESLLKIEDYNTIYSEDDE